MTLSLSGVISVSASEWASRVRWVSNPGVSTIRKSACPSTSIDRLAEQVELELLVFLDRVRAGQRQVVMGGVRQFEVARLRPVAAVLDVVGEGLLAAVDVDRGDAEALIEQVDREMEGGRGLARAALLIADDNDMRPRAIHWLLQTCPDAKTEAKPRFGSRVQFDTSMIELRRFRGLRCALSACRECRVAQMQAEPRQFFGESRSSPPRRSPPRSRSGGASFGLKIAPSLERPLGARRRRGPGRAP